MELPRDREQKALTTLQASLGPPPASVQVPEGSALPATTPSSSPAPAPAAAAPSVSSGRPAAARDGNTEWPTSSWDAYLDWVMLNG